MLNKLKNRKVSLGITIALILALVSGATFAWFTANVSAEKTSTELGVLELQGAFVDDVGDFLYQPGDTIELEASWKNTGTLGMIAKITLDATTTIRSDGNGKPLAEEDYYTLWQDTNIKTNFDESSIYSKMDEDLNIIAWFKDPDVPGSYYVVMNPGMEEEIAFEAEMNGNGMGNDYMRATVSFAGGIQATQTRTGATMELWGVDFDALIDMPLLEEEQPQGDMPQGSPLGRSASASTNRQAILDRVAELFDE